MNKMLMVWTVAMVVTATVLMTAGIFVTTLTQITLAQKNTTISVMQSNSQNATSNAKFLTYENSTLGIRIHYPYNWTKQTARDGIAFVVLPIGGNSNNPEKFVAKFNVTAIMGFPPNLPIKAMADHVIDGYRQFLPNFQIESYANSTLSNNSAIKIVYRFSEPKNNSSFMATDIATIKSDRLYVIQYYIQSPRSQIYLPTLKKMVDSFQITG